ncbi:MAG: putative Ig domain-containing protein [Gammaproteobacteria bacterium]|nr:putative Ig domain-containing protein [Gammaproteobacteria bacterium]
MSERDTAEQYRLLLEGGETTVGAATQKFAELQVLRLFGVLEPAFLETVLKTETAMSAFVQVARVNQLQALMDEAFLEASRLPAGSPHKAYHQQLGHQIRQGVEQAQREFLDQFAGSQRDFRVAVGQVFGVSGDMLSTVMGHGVGAAISYVDLKSQLDGAASRGEPPSAAAAIVANELAYTSTSSIAGVTRVMQEAVRTGNLRLAGGTTLQLGGGSVVHVVARAGAAGLSLWLAFQGGKIFGEAFYSQSWFNEGLADLIDYSVDLLTVDTALAAYPSEHGSMALLINALDPQVDMPQLVDVVEASTNEAESRAGLIAVYNQLAALLAPGAQPLGPDGDQKDFHRRVVETLRAGRERWSLGELTVMDLSRMDAADIAARALAPEGLAYRYALLHLAPFAVEGLPNLFEAFNDHGQLDLNNTANDGGMSPAYITDRATMLEKLMTRNRANENYIPGDMTNAYYLDMDSGIAMLTEAAADGFLFLKNRKPGRDTARYLFGPTEGGGELYGGEVGDHLYGGGGGDSLYGGKGDDRLEGGQGADRLYGGPGNDVLAGGAGDDILLGGHDPAAGPGSNMLRGGRGRDIYFARPGDVVADSDGDGLVLFGGQVLSGGVAETVGIPSYTSADKRVHYALAGTVLTVTRASGGQLTIEDFQPGELGIVLSDEAPEAVTYTLFHGTSGDDRGATIHDVEDGVAGDGQANQLFGYGGDDDLYGQDGPDMVLGGRGDDYLDGGTGDDLLQGGAGRDVLRGNWGDDRLLGGGETDVLSGDRGDDVLKGGAGGDALFGGSGADVLHGGADNDIVFGEGSAYATGRDWDMRVVLRPRAADEKAKAVRSSSLSSAVALGPLDMSNGDLVLQLPGAPHAAGGADHLYGGAGDDFLHGFDGADVLVGGAGDDGLFGDWDDDVVVGGAGHDFMVGGAGDDTLLGGADHDALWGNDGDDTLAGGGGHDLLHGDHPTAPGQTGDDVLYGDWGDDDLHGGAGDDVLHGGAGADRLWGGSGADALYGGRGDDHYYFAPGDGQDLLRDTVGTDTVHFSGGLHLGQLQFGLAGGALHIDYGDGDSLTLAGWAASSVDTLDVGGLVLVRRDIERFAALAPPAALVAGTPGTDEETATAGDDVLVFQGGDDVYHGGAGDDSYLVASGLTAEVTIVDGAGADSLSFLGAGDVANLAITRAGDALRLSHGPSDVMLPSWVDHGLAEVRLAEVRLGTGPVLTRATLDRYFHNRAPAVGAALSPHHATVDAPFAFTPPAGAFVDADGDPLSYRLDITRQGGSLPVELDWLAFDAATGALTGTPGEMDQGRFTAHLTAMDPYGGASAPQSFALDVALPRERNPLYATPPDARARPLAPFRYELPFAPTLFLTIAADENPGAGHAPEGTWLETQIAFHQGVIQTPLRHITDGMRLADLPMNDTLIMVGDDDGGETPPAIVPDWLHYDATTNALYGTPSTDDMARFEVRLQVRNHEIALPEHIIDITVPGLDAVPVVAVPPEAPEAIAGAVFYYALPAETVASGDGSPLSYRAQGADGTSLPDWLTFDAATRTFHGTPGPEAVGPLALEVVATDGDGDALPVELAVTVAPGPAAPPARVLTGGAEADVLVGGAGDDVLDGGGGVDVLVGGPGADHYTVDHPDDRVLERPGEGVDTVVLGHPNGPGARLADHVERLVVSEAARQTMGQWGIMGPWEHVYYRPRAYGNALDNHITGAAYDDVLKGFEGDDVLVGSDGLDEMYGGPGADTYRFGAGLTGESEVRLGPGDRIELVGPSPDEVTVKRGHFHYSDARLGDERRTYWRPGLGRGFGLHTGGLTVGSQEDFFSPAGADTSGFAGIDFDINGDGSADAHWSAADIAARLTTPTPGDDTLYAFDDGIPLYGGAGNDRLHAGAGDDTLYGGAGDDTLVAGWGDDRLEGGPGDDVYLWDETLALGMLGFPTGHDRIVDSADDDTVRFSTMRRDHLAFARIGDDLVIQGPGDDASLTVAAWFRDDTQRIERFTTAAGDTLVDTQVALLIQAMNQFVADDPGIDTWHQAVREHPQDTATLLAAHWEPAASMSG